jgi:hypothetical protein
VNLEKTCRAQLTIEASGLDWQYPDLAETEGKAATMARLSLWENFFAYYHRKLLRREGQAAQAERLRSETLGWKRGR